MTILVIIRLYTVSQKYPPLAKVSLRLHLLSLLLLTFTTTFHQDKMAPTPCSLCHTARALVKRPKTGQQVCKDCFFEVFETEVHNTIVEGKGIFQRGERVAIGASGGKGMSALS